MAARQHLKLPIEGMTCATCSTRIEKVVGRLSGVTEVTVNLASEQANVTLESERASPEQVVAAIQRAGYAVPASSVRLTITGMTCATCSSRVERVLRKQPGVISAQVNLATETSSVAYTTGLTEVPALVAAVERSGYGAALAPSDASQDRAREQAAARAARRDWAHLGIASLLTLPLVAPMLAMPSPEVLEVTMAWGETASATFEKSCFLISRSSITASNTQSASSSSDQVSSKFPGRIRLQPK